VAEAAEALAAAGMPSSKAEAASSMVIRLVILGNFTLIPPQAVKSL
jgi:hypothetical protein